MANEELMQLKNELTKLKIKHNETKKEIYDLKSENKIIKTENKKIKLKLENSVEKDKFLQYEKENKEIRVDLDYSTKKLSVIEYKYNEVCENLKNTKRELEKFKNDYLITKYKKHINGQRITIERLRHKIAKSNREIIENGDIKNIKYYLRLLNKRLSYKTLDLYDDKVYILYTRVMNMRNSKKYFYEKKQDESFISKSEPSIYGYLSSYKDDLIFYDIEGNYYNVCFSSNIKLNYDDIESILGITSRAKLLDKHNVRIVEIYESEDIINEEPSLISENIDEERKEEFDPIQTKISSFKYSRELEVLIIGSKNKREYIKFLYNTGLKPKWFDSFDKNPKRLKDLTSHADIIIACKDHMSHAVLDFIDETDPNTIIISRDTLRLVSSSVNFLIHKLNLAEIIVESNNETI